MNKLSDIVTTQKPAVSMTNVKKAGDTIANAGRKLVKTTGTGLAKTQVFLSSNSPLAYIVIGLLFIILVLLILFLTKNLLSWLYSSFTKKYVLLDSTKDASTAIVISQDPNVDGSITLPRSEDEESGIEFTYSFWLYVKNWY